MVATTDIVPDASAAIRALVEGDAEALGWFERVDAGTHLAWWPQMAYLEIANALRTGVRAQKMQRAQATATMDRALRWPITSVSLVELATPALAIALDRSLTPYDACYVILAELHKATLVTADRTLAAATPNSVLLD